MLVVWLDNSLVFTEGRARDAAAGTTYHFGDKRRRNAQLLDGPPIDASEPGLIVDIARLAGGHSHSLGWLAFKELMDAKICIEETIR